MGIVNPLLFIFVFLTLIYAGLIFCKRAGINDTAERILWTATLSFWLLCAITYISGMCRNLNNLTLLIFAALIFTGARIAAKKCPEIQTEKTELSFASKAILYPAGLLAAFATALYLPLSPSSWDAITYHIYTPCRWVQEGMIFHVPTVFSDISSAFVPLNWELFNAGIMALLKADEFLKVPGIILLLITGFAVSLISLKLGAGRFSSIAAGAFFVVVPPIFENAFSCCADIPLTTFLLISFYGSISYITEKKDFSAWLAFAAGGLALGMKTIGPAYALPVLATTFIVAASRKNWKMILFAVPLVILCGGCWYIENLVRYGNPLFPVKSFLFQGAYTTAALKLNSPFNTDSFPRLMYACYRYFGAPGLLLFALGTGGTILGILKGKKEERSCGIYLFATFTIWAIIYIFVIPHNLQARFFFPSFALAMAGAGTAFERFSKTTVTIAAFYLFIAWSIFRNAAFFEAGLSCTPFWISAIGLAIIVAAILLRKRVAAVMILTTATLYIASYCGPSIRQQSVSFEDYSRVWKNIYERFNTVDEKLPPLSIAYTGGNIPHAMTGAGLRNRVFYCPVNTEKPENYFDQWIKAGKSLSWNPYNPLYRVNPSQKIWLKNLYASGADVLAVFRLHPLNWTFMQEQPDHYPLEAAWAEKNPALFQAVWKGNSGAIYLIDRAKLAKRITE